MRRQFWKNRRVLLTGNTGFKGAWLAALLDEFGADVTGLALAPDTDPALSLLIEPLPSLSAHTADLRDRKLVADVTRLANPEIVIHMAAQAHVGRGYLDPHGTFETNVMGTANLLTALRELTNVAVILVATSDKVYRNADNGRRFSEDDALGGSDPYSASKACCELLVSSFCEMYFQDRNVAVACARAGNVVGGGDFSPARLVPDIYRSIVDNKPLVLRYPTATRPWQHVLDCIGGYLTFAEYLYQHRAGSPPALNFAPDGSSTLTVTEVVAAMSSMLGKPASYQVEPNPPPEKRLLALNADLAKRTIGWSPHLSMDQTLKWTAEWYADFARGSSAGVLVRNQIKRHLAGA